MKLKKDDMFHFGNKCIIGGISTDCVCTVNGRTFFWGKNTYGLFEYRDGKCKYILREKPDEINEIMGYSLCCEFECYIVFAPYYCSSICLFDYHKNNADFIPIGRQGLFGYGICTYDSKIFFFGVDDGHMVLDMRDRKVRIIDELSGIKIRSMVCQVDRFVYAAIDEDGSLLKIDLSDLSVQLQKVDDKRIVELCHADEYLWIMFFDGSLTKMDLRTNEKYYLELPDSICDRNGMEDEPAMGKMLKMGDHIYCSPLRKDSFIRVNYKTNIVERICKIERNVYPIGMYLLNDDNIACIIISRKSYNVYGGLVFDLDGSAEERTIFLLDDEIDYAPVMNESACSTLKMYIKSITKSR